MIKVKSMKQRFQTVRMTRAALEVVAERGLWEANMAMIAERARVGAGTIYRYCGG